MVKLNVERPVQLCRQTSQNVHNSTKKRITCRDNLTRACLSIITKQTRALPLLAVCTLCLCTESVHTVSVHTMSVHTVSVHNVSVRTISVHTVSVHAVSVQAVSVHTVSVHSPRIPSRVVVSLSIGHAHCIPTNIWQLTNRSYKIFTFETSLEILDFEWKETAMTSTLYILQSTHPGGIWCWHN